LTKSKYHVLKKSKFSVQNTKKCSISIFQDRITDDLSHSQSKRTEPEVNNDVKTAVNRLVEEENLTGDGCNSLCLPIVRGKHQDLKSITPQTVRLFWTNFNEMIEEEQILYATQIIYFRNIVL